jgi:hypothetical protein
MQSAIILNVAALLEQNATEVAAERCARPHIAARPNHNVAENDGIGVDEGRYIDDGHHTVDRIRFASIGAHQGPRVVGNCVQSRMPYQDASGVTFQIRIRVVAAGQHPV